MVRSSTENFLDYQSINGANFCWLNCKIYEGKDFLKSHKTEKLNHILYWADEAPDVHKLSRRRAGNCNKRSCPHHCYRDTPRTPKSWTKHSAIIANFLHIFSIISGKHYLSRLNLVSDSSEYITVNQKKFLSTCPTILSP